MTTEKFVCATLGIDGHVLDKLCDDFDVDIMGDELIPAVKEGVHYTWGVGMELLLLVFAKIQEKYPELEEEKFDCDVSSPSYPSFYYDGHEFHSKQELDAIAGQKED